jgi:hypothetical protein
MIRCAYCDSEFEYDPDLTEPPEGQGHIEVKHYPLDSIVSCRTAYFCDFDCLQKYRVNNKQLASEEL